jgi:membrane carboxypeptidase/penicillin-binding protein
MARALADKPAEDFAAPENVVFVKIDPTSGLLAREGAADAINDVFRKGTEPTQYDDMNKGPKEGQFYMLDQGEEIAPVKKQEEADD